MTMVIGYAGSSWGFLAHSTRPRVSDGESVWHEDIEVPGVSLFDDGAVAGQGDLSALLAVHAAMDDAPSAPVEEHVRQIRRAQSRTIRRSVAVLLTHGPEGTALSAVNHGTSRSGYEGPPVDRFPRGAMVVMPPGCWPVDETHEARPPTEVATLERAFTSWLAELGDEVPAPEAVAQRVGLLYRVAAELTPSVAPTPEVAFVVRGRDPMLLPMLRGP